MRLEAGGQNLLLWSEEFNNASWTQAYLNEQVTANAATSPSGTTSADQIASANGVTAEFGIGQSVTIAANTAHCFSVFAKAAASGFMYFRYYGNAANAFYTIVVDLSTGVATKTSTGASTTATSTSVSPHANDWWKVSLTANHGVALTSATCIAGPAPSSNPTIGGSFGEISYTGSTGQSIYLWGAQLETGTSPTSYIPTTTAAVTRTADSAVINGSGVITGTYTMVEKPAGCAVINGTDIELQNGYTVERVMIFPATLTAGQITAIRAAM